MLMMQMMRENTAPAGEEQAGLDKSGDCFTNKLVMMNRG
jgi:hypothetical protein